MYLLIFVFCIYICFVYLYFIFFFIDILTFILCNINNTIYPNCHTFTSFSPFCLFFLVTIDPLLLAAMKSKLGESLNEEEALALAQLRITNSRNDSRMTKKVNSCLILSIVKCLCVFYSCISVFVYKYRYEPITIMNNVITSMFF